MIKNFTKGLLFGATLGGTLGILFAPKSGKDLQRDLTQEVDEATEISMDLNRSLQNFNRSVMNLKLTAENTIPSFKEDMEKRLTRFQFEARTPSKRNSTIRFRYSKSTIITNRQRLFDRGWRFLFTIVKKV